MIIPWTHLLLLHVFFFFFFAWTFHKTLKAFKKKYVYTYTARANSKPRERCAHRHAHVSALKILCETKRARKLGGLSTNKYKIYSFWTAYIETPWNFRTSYERAFFFFFSSSKNENQIIKKMKRIKVP